MKLEDIRKLHQRKGREALGRFLVEGEHPVLELQKAAARNPLLLGAELFVTREQAGWRSPFTTHVISSLQMARIADTQSPQGIIAVAPLLRAMPPTAGERAFYLQEVSDPGNLGTILRTLGWFGGLRVLLGPGSVDPYNPKVVRASMGAIFHVPFEVDVEPAALRARFKRIAALDMRGSPLPAEDFSRHDAYLFGNEARGLPPGLLQELGAHAFTIPGRGAIDSLNLATVVNLCAYELNR